MSPTSWAARLARREVCASCSDQPVPGQSCCAYHLERHALQARAAWQDRRRRLGLPYEVIVVPPPRAHRRALKCKICASIEHGTSGCSTPAAKRRRALLKARDRQRREDQRYAAGLCVACEETREPGNKKRRCKACLKYHRQAVNRTKRASERKAA